MPRSSMSDDDIIVVKEEPDLPEDSLSDKHGRRKDKKKNKYSHRRRQSPTAGKCSDGLDDYAGTPNLSKSDREKGDVEEDRVPKVAVSLESAVLTSQTHSEPEQKKNAEPGTSNYQDGCQTSQQGDQTTPGRNSLGIESKNVGPVGHIHSSDVLKDDETQSNPDPVSTDLGITDVSVSNSSPVGERENPETHHCWQTTDGDHKEIKSDLVDKSKLKEFKETSKNIKFLLDKDLNSTTDTLALHPADTSAFHPTDKSISHSSVSETSSDTMPNIRVPDVCPVTETLSDQSTKPSVVEVESHVEESHSLRTNQTSNSSDLHINQKIHLKDKVELVPSNNLTDGDTPHGVQDRLVHCQPELESRETPAAKQNDSTNQIASSDSTITLVPDANLPTSVCSSNDSLVIPKEFQEKLSTEYAFNTCGLTIPSNVQSDTLKQSYSSSKGVSPVERLLSDATVYERRSSLESISCGENTSSTSNKGKGPDEPSSPFSTNILQVIATKNDLLSDGECSPDSPEANNDEETSMCQTADNDVQCVIKVSEFPPRRSKTPEVTAQRYRSIGNTSSIKIGREKKENGKKTKLDIRNRRPETERSSQHKQSRHAKLLDGKFKSSSAKSGTRYKSSPVEKGFKTVSSGENNSQHERRSKTMSESSKMKSSRRTRMSPTKLLTTDRMHKDDGCVKYSTNSYPSSSRGSSSSIRSDHNRHSVGRSSKKVNFTRFRSDEYHSTTIISMDNNSGKVKTRDLVPSRKSGGESCLTTQAKSPVRFPSPGVDLEVIEVLPIPKPPPLIVFIDSD